MAKKLTFTTTATTASKQRVLDNMRDLTFDMNTSMQTVDIGMTTPERAIEQSLINALQLRVGGNVLFPEKGSPIVNMLFNSNADLADQRTTLMAFIAANEPRITVTDLSLKFVEAEFGERAAVIDLNYSFMSATNINRVTITVLGNGK